MKTTSIKKISSLLLLVALVIFTGGLSSCYFKPDDVKSSGTGSSSKEYYEPLKIGTYNIQYDNLNDAVNSWSSRNAILEDILEEMDLDIFGVQEPHRAQINDMLSYLGDRYAWTGKNINGRTDQERVHYNPIFYKKDRFEVKKEGMFWLSETPDAPSKFTDSYSVRMCYWVHFLDSETGVEFYHFNCHFDHIGGTAKNQSGLLVPDKIAEIAGDLPAFLTGDFNSNQRTTAYNNILSKGIVADSYTKAQVRDNEYWPTYNDYKYITTPPANATRIDHVFVTTNGTKVNSWKIFNNAYSQKYPSDHFPVVIEWSFEKKSDDE